MKRKTSFVFMCLCLEFSTQAEKREERRKKNLDKEKKNNRWSMEVSDRTETMRRTKRDVRIRRKYERGRYVSEFGATEESEEGRVNKCVTLKVCAVARLMETKKGGHRAMSSDVRKGEKGGRGLKRKKRLA